MSAGSVRRSQSIRDDGLRPVRLSSLAEELDQVDRRTFAGLEADREVREQLPPHATPPPVIEAKGPVLLWEDPPPSRTSTCVPPYVERELRANPGRWARLPGTSQSSVHGWCKKHPGFQSICRIRNGSRAVYIRYVG